MVAAAAVLLRDAPLPFPAAPKKAAGREAAGGVRGAIPTCAAAPAPPEQGARGCFSLTCERFTPESSLVAVMDSPGPQKGTEALKALASPEDTDTAPPALEARREEAAIPATAVARELRTAVETPGALPLLAMLLLLVVLLLLVSASVCRTLRTTLIMEAAAAGGKGATALALAALPSPPRASTAPLETPRGRESCEMAVMAARDAREADAESCVVTVVIVDREAVSATAAESPRGTDTSAARAVRAAVVLEEFPLAASAATAAAAEDTPAALEFASTDTEAAT